MKNIHKDQRLSEPSLEYINSILRALRSINRLIIRERDQNRLISQACRLIAEAFAFHSAWIMLVNENGVVERTAEHGFGAPFKTMNTRVRKGESFFCISRALAKSGVIGIKDRQKSCERCPLQQHFPKLAALSVRLEHQDIIYGMLTVTVDMDYFEESNSRALLQQVAADLGYALHHLNLELEKERVLASLQESENNFRYLACNSPDGIIITRTDGQIIFANKRACEITGYSTDELLSMSDREMIRSEDIPEYKELTRKRMADEPHTSVCERVLVGKDGKHIVAELLATTTFWRGEKHPMVTIRDVTEQKRTRNRIQHLNKVLRAVRHVNHLITKELDVASLIRKSCDLLIETGGYSSACIVLVDCKGDISRLALAGDSPKNELVKGKKLPQAFVKVQRSSEIIRIPADGEFDKQQLLYRLQHGDKMYGVIAISFATDIEVNEEELDLFQEVADDISFALYHIEAEQERRRALQALQEQNSLQKALIDSPNNISIFSLDRDYRYIFYNQNHVQEMRKIFNIEIEPGMNILELLPDKDLKVEAKKTFDRAFGGDRFTVSRRMSISGRFLQASLNPVKTESGDIIGLAAFVKDITEQQKTEQALIESEERFRKAFFTSPDSMSITRIEDGMYIDINEGFTKITGYTREEVIGKTSIELNIWTNPAGRKKLIDELKKNGRVENLEAKFRIKDGAIRTGLVSAALFDINGAPHILAVTRSIDDIIEAQEALKESEQRFHVLFEESPVPLWEQDVSKVKNIIEKIRKKGVKNFQNYLDKHEDLIKECIQKIRIIDVNKAVLDLYDAASKEEFIARFFHTMTPETLITYKKLLISIWNGNSQMSFDAAIQTLSNETKYVSLNWMAVPGYEDSLARTIVATVDITERKRSVEALRETEKLLYEAQRIGRVGSWQNDLVAGELWWSDGAYRIYGLDPKTEQATMELFLSKVHPDDREYVLSSYQSSVQEKKPFSIVHRILLDDGGVKYVNQRCETHYDADGKPLRSIGTVQDITETKQAEDALKQAMTQYRNLIEQSNDAIYLIYENKFERINPKFKEMFGYTLEECNAPDFHFMNLVAEESQPLIKERMRKFFAGEPVDPVFEFTAISKDGKRIKCEASVSRFSYKTGVATQGIIRDIGARKKTEEELRKLLQAVEQSPTSVIITNLEGRIEYANPRFTQLTGYSFDEVRNEKPNIFQPERMAEDTLKEIWDTISDGKVWEGEYQNTKKNGEIYWEDVAISPIFNKQGLITHYLYIGEDVTDKKELEEQFLQSQKMEAIGQLAGGVAHDFNNLLTIINGYSELLLSSLDRESPLFNGIQQIRQAGNRAESLTRQLLAFSRKQIMQPKVLDINELIYNMEKMLRRLIGEDIDLVTIYEKDLHRVKVDPGQFEQVVLNLVINARDAMPVGGSLTIETRNEYFDEHHALLHNGTKPGWHATLIVSDTGKGMDKETQSRIFEPFYTTKGKGTGLGLSTVYGIMKQSGGATTVESEPGRGATFKLYFPAMKEMANKTDEHEVLVKEPMSHETILIAEDEESVRELATLALQKFGYKVLTVENGPEALKVIETYPEKIDLLLTDVIMPKMSGKELADIITEHHPDIKVLYMSGYTDDSIVHHGVLDKGTHFIQKPFTPDRLVRKIRKIINPGK